MSLRAWSERTFAALAQPRFRHFLLGHAASTHGFWMRIAAQGWLVYHLTGSTAALGAVSAAGLLPTVVISPLAGALADRHDKRGLLVLLALGTMAVNLALAVSVLLGRVTVLHVGLTAVAVGCLRAAEMPVRQAYVVDVVGREVLGNALALQASVFNLARVLGPTLAGVVLAAAGPGACFVAVAALALLTALTLARLPRTAVRAPEGRAGVLAEVWEGLRYVGGHARLRLQMALMAGSMVLAWTWTGMLPALAQDAYGLAERGYGVLMGLSGAGALAGALWVGGRAGHVASGVDVLVRLVGLGALAVAGLAQAPTPWLAAPALLLAAFCQVGFMSTSNTLIQGDVPDRLRGRVMGLWVLVFGLAAPAGSLCIGLLAQRLGLRTALTATSLLAVALSVLLGARLRAAARRLAPGESPVRRAEAPAVPDAAAAASAPESAGPGA